MMTFSPKQYLFAAIATLMIIPLAGCPASPYASLQCTATAGYGTQPKAPPKGGGAEVIGQVSTTPSAGVTGILSSTIGYTGAIDASSFSLNTTGSSVAWPSTGVIVVAINNSTTGAVISEQSFNFNKVGALVEFANPASVDAWISASGAPSTSNVTFAVQPFDVVATAGTNTVAVAAQIGGTTMSTSTVTFQGSACDPNIHTPGKCIGNL
jgi:hypothetical protein